MLVKLNKYAILCVLLLWRGVKIRHVAEGRLKLLFEKTRE